MPAAEEGEAPGNSIFKESVGYQRNSAVAQMGVSERGGAEFLTAVENTRAIKVTTGAVCAVFLSVLRLMAAF